MIDEKPWYKDGLSFKCTGCGKCCTGAPGYVWVNEKEIAEMADFLEISIKEFSIKYLRKVNGRFALVETKKHYDCIFLKDKKCLVYGARPTQCRTFPFWPQILKNQNSWQATAKDCEGIHNETSLVDFQTISSYLHEHEQSINENGKENL